MPRATLAPTISTAPARTGVDAAGRLVLESHLGDRTVACGEITTIDGKKIR